MMRRRIRRFIRRPFIVSVSARHAAPATRAYRTPQPETAQCPQAALRVPSDGQDLAGLSIPIVPRSTALHRGRLAWGAHQRRDAGGSWRGSQSSMPQKAVPSGSWPQSLWPSNGVCETDIPHVFD